MKVINERKQQAVTPEPVREALTRFGACLLLPDERQVVGVRFLRTKEDYGASPLDEAKGPLPYCVAVKLATHGRTQKLDRSLSRCGGGRRGLGLDDVSDAFRSGEICYDFGLYRDLETAAAFAGQMTFLPENSLYGLDVGPLSALLDRGLLPDVVIAVVDARQMMRVVQAAAYGSGSKITFQTGANQAACSEITATPYLENSLNVSFGCSGTRRYAGWKDTEILLGLSTETFVRVADGLHKTANRAEPDARQHMIAARLEVAGLKSGTILEGRGYFRKKST